jgi:hypothetical protein
MNNTILFQSYDLTVEQKEWASNHMSEFKTKWPHKYWAYLAHALKSEYGKSCPEITGQQLKNKMASHLVFIFYFLLILLEK